MVLDEDTLDRLTLSMDPVDQTMEMRPGETRTFSLGVIECCYILELVEACATWSVDPPEGASIDPDTGFFTVDAQTLSGSVFTVSADVDNGRRVVSVEVHVFTPEDNPLVGLWREEAQYACGTGEEVVPEQPIGELRFRADGSFGVTWMPFEIYVDYWGTYAYDLPRGTLDLVIEGGNCVPDDVDGSGLFSLHEEGRLILRDMWLGRPRGQTGAGYCGHRLSQ
ncbi:MAG: hypothetical protein CEE40_12635 [Chloroflexi bacterium B3_Chlor]|nr:MAG: hypothetical protein CEE40_12635 [Chloroflexi bacterium B3_Chlor]